MCTLAIFPRDFFTQHVAVQFTGFIGLVCYLLVSPVNRFNIPRSGFPKTTLTTICVFLWKGLNQDCGLEMLWPTSDIQTYGRSIFCLSDPCNNLKNRNNTVVHDTYPDPDISDPDLVIGMHSLFSWEILCKKMLRNSFGVWVVNRVEKRVFVSFSYCLRDIKWNQTKIYKSDGKNYEVTTLVLIFLKMQSSYDSQYYCYHPAALTKPCHNGVFI